MDCLEVYVVNNPCWLDCYIDTCSKKIQSEIFIQMKTLLRATFKNQLWELAKVAVAKEKWDALV